MARIGIDLVSVRRFAPYARKRTHAFLQKVFTQRELEYCFSYKDAATHLAGHFAAKEAASKALGTRKYPTLYIEIRHAKDGAPVLFFKGKKLNASVSISHDAGFAVAAVIG